MNNHHLFHLVVVALGLCNLVLEQREDHEVTENFILLISIIIHADIDLRMYFFKKEMYK